MSGQSVRQDPSTSKDLDEQVLSMEDFASLEEPVGSAKGCARLFSWQLCEEMPRNCSSGTLTLGSGSYKASL